jgi:hypothetical protein
MEADGLLLLLEESISIGLEALQCVGILLDLLPSGVFPGIVPQIKIMAKGKKRY